MVSFSVTVNAQVCYFVAMYGAVNYETKRTLWAHLMRLQYVFSGLWQFLGDFNVILGAHEKKGGCLFIAQSCQDFIDWTQVRDLTHINTRGSNFTWSNGLLAIITFRCDWIEQYATNRVLASGMHSCVVF